ncbi:Clp protease N-terminal domain-containing protein [Actinomycetospora atypica]|uniref:Clp protease N-terminal domain-containing protein n=1 Tax=Actinomycetospora atypica TaxID=1290095 RepID=A0ABV9YU16_9PSEU
MTVTPIFDDLVARLGTPAGDRPAPGPAQRRPSPRPRPAGPEVDAAAFGRGCLAPVADDDTDAQDELARLVEGARREAVALGQGCVDTLHLLLAAVRDGGDVGRAFGMRGAGPAVLVLAAGAGTTDADGTPPLGSAPDSVALSSVARTVLRRVTQEAGRARRPLEAVDVVLALLRTGRVADLLRDRGVDVADLVDVLECGRAPEPDTVVVPASVPGPAVGLAPVTVLLRPVPAERRARPVDVPA